MKDIFFAFLSFLALLTPFPLLYSFIIVPLIENQKYQAKKEAFWIFFKRKSPGDIFHTLGPFHIYASNFVPNLSRIGLMTGVITLMLFFSLAACGFIPFFVPSALTLPKVFTVYFYFLALFLLKIISCLKSKV